ncbi:MAG: 2-oxoacid:acceptor oxidoreductase family protein [Actinobacteria bacterium]|nr:2-oxoacid:acceptor oxidoreductase family protein [Actinomycetota bacterium]
MIQLRIHGRGGQGVVALAEILAICAIREGKYAQAFPSFGPERRGAPVVSYCRVAEEPIYTREPVQQPDIVLVLDSTVLRVVDVLSGLKPNGKLVVNACESPEDLAREHGCENCLVATVDASGIALRNMGRDITNTAMMGALLKVETIVDPHNSAELIRTYFKDTSGKNVLSFWDAYRETQVADFSLR